MSISFFQFSGLGRLWAFGMMGLARPYLSRVEGLSFWKLCGSGTGEGFTPVPNTGVYAVLSVWENMETARKQTKSGVFAKYISMSRESWTVFLAATSSRGSWSGRNPFSETVASRSGPVAALTRATIKPWKAVQFWRRVPNISAVIGEDPHVAFKIGIGEVPLLHQVTFSIWPDTETMAGFARKDGPHARAIRAVREGDWFREELYARFRVVGSSGTWNGAEPLHRFAEVG